MISAFVITRNSEKYLRRALESLRFCDEIVVVDSFSNDRTVEIAKSLGARVIQGRFWSFSEKKGFARSQCRSEWILNIDADEYVPQKTAEEIILSVRDGKYDSYSIPFETYFKDRRIRFGRHKGERHIRLFKRRFCYGSESVHEKVEVCGTTGRLRNPIIHTPYECIDDIKKRAIRNARLSARDKVKMSSILLLICCIFNPLIRFIRDYFLFLGFMDGVVGFYLAYYSAREVYYKYLWGLRMRKGLLEDQKDVGEVSV